jgi:hypothetical protein
MKPTKLKASRLATFLLVLLIATSPALAQVPAPYDDETSFWNNPETIKKLKLTPKQLQELHGIFVRADKDLAEAIESKLTPEQRKQIESMRKTQPSLAARLGFYGPDAAQIAKALQLNRSAAENYSILINMSLSHATGIAAEYLQIRRSTTKDPCQDALEAFTYAGPQLDLSLAAFSFDFNGKKHSGKSCPDAASELTQNTPTTVEVTYPCAASPQGVNLAPGCQFRAAVTAYEY